MLEKLRKFLATQGQVRLIEAIVDPDIQIEYLEFASKIRKNFDNEEVISNSDKIFDPEINFEEKKRLLVLMASIDNIDIYRKLEKFIDIADDDLKSWALIAHQESQTVIQSSLLEENQILVSTGLGGKDQKMRFFIVMQVEPKDEITEAHQNIIKNEVEYAFYSRNCDLEKIEFKEFFCTMVALIPFEVEIEKIFQEIIIETNNLGVYLSDKFIVTNVKIHTLDETKELITELDEKAKQELEANSDKAIELENPDLFDFDNLDFEDEDFEEDEDFDDDDDDDDEFDEDDFF